MAFLLSLMASANGEPGRIELLMFESAGCEWCTLWRDEIGPVYPKTEEGKLAPLRPVSIHAPRPPDLEGITGIVFTPTFVLWDGNREIGRIVGYGGEIQFWGLLDMLLGKLKSALLTPAEILPTDRTHLRGTPVENSSGSGK
jgi:hypothetical protein